MHFFKYNQITHIVPRILFGLSEIVDLCHVENISNESFRLQLGQYIISANGESVLQRKTIIFGAM